MILTTPYSEAGALEFISEHGVVHAAARGPVPRLIEAIAGEPILGNWWSHPQANRIYNILTQVQKSEQVLVCKLVNDKITLVHRRLWPALARLAHKLEPKQLARWTEEHTAGGRHVARAIQFPNWVPAAVLEEAHTLSEEEAVAVVGCWLSTLFSKEGKFLSAGRRRKPHDA